VVPERYGEIIGGSQRIDNYDLLKARIEEAGGPYMSNPHTSGAPIMRLIA
jgi:aspartyl/asparaginyl-tRNA synthetase